MAKIKNMANEQYNDIIVVQIAQDGYQKTGSNTVWKCRCSKCEKTLYLRRDHLLKGVSTRCLGWNHRPKTKRKKSSSLKLNETKLIQGKDIPMYNFIDETGNIYGELTVVERDINYNKKSAKWICQCTCGNLVSRVGSQLRIGASTSCGCKTPLSKGEDAIKNILVDLGYKFQQEYSFSDLLGVNGRPLRFDFCLYDNNNNILGLIEYDGEQHFSASGWGEDQLKYIQKHDVLKNEYATDNGIPLLRIPYTQLKNLEKTIAEWLSTLNQQAVGSWA